jgi:hypothetical protein
MVAQIIFLQGEAAEPILKGINRVGPRKVVNYLSQWDNDEYNDTSDTSNNGTHDTTIIVGHYLLTFNFSYQTVGLERVLPRDYFKHLSK